MHILLIDDDAELNRMLSEYLYSEGLNCTAIERGESGITAALSGQYNVVILDVMLPDINGIEVLKTIRKSSDIPIIMLTARGDNLDRVLGLEIGADDYVAKPYYPRELVARLRAVSRRYQFNQNRQLSVDLLRIGQLTLSKQERQVKYYGSALDLTISEFNVLEILMQYGSSVASKEVLSSEALKREHVSYDRSVDVHISNIRQKFQVTGIHDIEIETVRGLGYRLKHS